LTLGYWLKLFIAIGKMDFITSFLSNINFELIAQLLMLSLIVIAGPVVIVLLAFRGGDM
jgi:hypothetical protein